jgi:general secretion pathway protein D
MNCKLSRQKILTLLTYLTIAIFFIGGCTGSIRYLEKGKEHAALKEWDQSVQNFQKALAADPENSEIKLLLARAKLAASMAHMVKGQEYLKGQLFNEAIEEFKISISFHPANRKAGFLMEKAQKMKASEHYYKKGDEFLKAQKYFEAREAFKKALELNEAHEKAQKALSHFKKKDERPAKFRVDLKSEAPVSFKFKQTPIFNVFEVLSRLSGINFIFDKEIIESKVTMFMTDISFDRFIEVLLRTNKLASKLVNEKTMLIYPDTPAKAKEYQDLQIRTFYLDNLEAEKAVRILSKILKSKDIIANKNNNSIVIRGSKDVVEIAARIIKANDRLPAEVLLHVEILEVKREKEEELGLTVDPSSITFGLGETSLEMGDNPSFSSTASIYALENTSKKNAILSLPTATLHFLKQDGDTKILAKPQVRVKNNEKATVHIGERIPLRTNRRVDTTGAITSDFQYQDVGVKLDVVPTISKFGEISMKITLEISQLGPNLGTTDEPQYSVLTRKTQSVLTVPDGEVVFIGGLIQDNESETIRKIPFLGDLPLIGRLFSNFDTTKSETDVIMTIIPIIIREQESVGTEITRIWSGNERNPSLGEPFESYIEKKDAYSDQPDEAYFYEKDDAVEEEKIAPENPTEDNSPPPDTKSTVPPLKDRPEEYQAAESPLKQEEPTDKNSREDLPQDVATTSKVDDLNYFWPESVPYSIHVNSFSEKLLAEERIKELSEHEYDSYLVYVHIPSMGYYYRIFVGQFDSRKSAESFCEKLKGKKEFAKDIHATNRKWAFGG